MELNQLKKTTIGGQAIIEGLLMIGPENSAIAIRKPNGEIIVTKKNIAQNGNMSKVPFIRGIVNIFKQVTLGIDALMYSSSFIDLDYGDNEKPSKIEKYLDKIFGDKIKDVMMYASLGISFVFAIGIFILLPNITANMIHFNKNTSLGSIYYNLIEGIIRIVLFIAYLILVSKMKDVQRLWQYHGAEHKTIHCYENEKELTIENVKLFSTRHPRCGTSFLFTVMVISILVFSFAGWHNPLINVLIRILLIPVVASISYEIIKFAGKSNFSIVNTINAPGIFFQRFTTREPDDSQIEVAIEALKSVLPEDKNVDEW